jgi:glycosyltransferase involved in cell wall biosynthesis
MKISVVMSVYNGAQRLPETLDSILAQSEEDFELLVIDDGSTDETPNVLADYAVRDPRIRVIRQTNQGLTRALIRGCAEARAAVIARHDNGDRSHPERFARQLEMLTADVVLVTCTTRYVGPEQEFLYDTFIDGEETRRSLLQSDEKQIHGLTSHGSAMFRRDAYAAAGGYRPEFYFAQDLDLWIRIARLGRIASVDRPLYTLRIEPHAISSMNRDAQVRLTRIAIALRDGGEERELLGEAARVQRSPTTRRRQAAGLYFIGRCLRSRRDPRARSYFARAVAHDPLHIRAWLSLVSGR